MGSRRIRGALAALLLVTTGASAADVVIEGCNERLPGEIGVRELVADVGQLVGVPITVSTVSPVDAFELDLEVPPGLLAYVRTDPGNLTTGFDPLDGYWHASASRVRVAGFSPTPIPAGTTGRLAIVVFEVVAPGAGTFGTSRLGSDLADYVSCEDLHDPSPVAPVDWGRVKALYRSTD